MFHALGISETTFTPFRPGRLCRGRERWIEPWPLEEGEGRGPEVHRLVISGAEFEDDSAARANRGIPFSGLELAAVVQALLPRRQLLAFCEDGHPADIPERAEQVELYPGHRAGGRSEELRVRWVMPVRTLTELREAIGPGQEPLAQGMLWLDQGVAFDDPTMLDALFLLTGMGSVDSPPQRFQPGALPDLLETCKAVVLFHRDKHGPAIGVYARDPITGVADRLEALTDKAGSLAVPFAIPPMLARWDRALSEARSRWLETRGEPFPVPAAPERPRHSRGRGRQDLARKAKAQARRARGDGEE